MSPEQFNEAVWKVITDARKDQRRSSGHVTDDDIITELEGIIEGLKEEETE